MASSAQIRANRLNSRRSTGPKTGTGLENTKYNALKHGLAAQELVLPDEDPAALEALREQLRIDYAPANQTESMLVEDLAQCWWRLQRARKYETAGVTVSINTRRGFHPDIINGIQRYTASAERGWHRALVQLRNTQNDRMKRDLPNTTPAPSPQLSETRQVMSIGSVLQNDVMDSPTAPPVPSRPANPTGPALEDVAIYRALKETCPKSFLGDPD